MIFYEVEILSVPEIKFAYNVHMKKYKNKFHYKENFLEIALCREGRIEIEYENGEREITLPKMLLPMLSDISCVTRAYENEPQKHITVGMTVKYIPRRIDSEMCDVSLIEKRVASGNVALVPYHTDMEEYYDEVKNLLRKIITASRTDKYTAIGYWYALLGVLTDFVLKRLRSDDINFPASELLYAERATEYIAKNYAKKITVKEIAEFLGISEGYLHRIFRDVKNCSVLEFINKHRIFVATELMKNKSLPLKEVAHNVGIEDPCYMSRLFKKVMGISYREYVNAKLRD